MSLDVILTLDEIIGCKSDGFRDAKICLACGSCHFESAACMMRLALIMHACRDDFILKQNGLD